MAEFGAALRALTKGRVRGLSEAADVPRSTVSGWAKGQHLPNPNQMHQLRRLLTVLGVPAAAHEDWVEAALRARQGGPSAPPPVVPYRGLQPFTEDDAELYFGRDDLVDFVLDRLAGVARLADGPRLVPVVGVSGAGKSSLLRAGVVAVLRRPESDTPVAVFRPGDDPLGRLADALAELTGGSVEAIAGELRAGRTPEQVRPGTVLVIDQFEEVLTEVADESERRAFFDALGRLTGPGGGVSAVIGVRADFYGRFAETEGFGDALQHHQVLVRAMRDAQLRQAIVEPARAVGVQVEDALVELLLRDVGPRSRLDGVADAGALPLLSHALLETFARARQRVMTVADYVALGGLAGAVEQTAEHAFHQLDPHAQDAAPELFLRLVNVDEHGTVTRRSLDLDELTGDDERARLRAGVVDHFVQARLLTVDAEQVTLSHEALLTAWPRLRSWVADDRDALTDLRRVRDAADAWETNGRDDGLLLSGPRLERATSWLGSPSGRRVAAPRERDFVTRSAAAADQRAHQARRGKRRLVALAVVASLLAVVATVAAVDAARSRDTARQERNEARSRRVALQAERIGETDPALAAQLALVAFDTADTLEARSALLDRRALATDQRIVGGAGSTALGVGGGGELFAVTDAPASTVRVYRLDDEGRPELVHEVVAPAGTPEYYGVAVSPDGATLVAGGNDGSVTVWDVSGGEPEVRAAALGAFGDGVVYSVTFRPDGSEFAVAGAGDAVQRFATGTLEPLAPLPVPGVSKAVAYSPDGSTIATGGDAGDLLLFELEAAGPQLAMTVPQADPEAREELNAVTFTPDGRLLAAGYRSGVLRLFEAGRPSVGASAPPLEEIEAPATGFTSWLNTLAFSPDGTVLAAGSSDTTLKWWRTDDWSPVREVTLPGPLTGLGYVGDGAHMVSTGFDGTARVWSMNTSPFAGPRSTVFSVSTADDRLAVFPGRSDGTIELWDTSQLPVMTPLNDRIPGPDDLGLDGTGALLPGGELAVGGTAEGPGVLWDLGDDPAAVTGPTSRLEGAQALVEMVAANADGSIVAIGSDDTFVHLFDVSDPSAPERLEPVFQAPELILGLAFHPSEPVIAVAAADDQVYLWRYEDGDDGELLGGFEGDAQSVAFTDDGSLLAASSADGAVLVWDTSELDSPVLLDAPVASPQASVYSLDFQPGSRLLAAAVQDGSVWLWDLDDPTRPSTYATLRAPDASINSVAFSTDGEFVIGSGAGRLIYAWQIDAQAVRDWVCDATGDWITDEEWADLLPDLPVTDPCG